MGAELELVERPNASRCCAARSSRADDYDFILIDCPPSLGLLTLNVLTAADAVIIPIQCEYYALEGISQLLNTIRLVQQNFNPGLAIDGVLLTMFDTRINLARQVANDAREYFGPGVFRTVIPRNVRLAEAPSFGKPILLYDVQSVGAKSYLSVAQELMRRVECRIGPGGALVSEARRLGRGLEALLGPGLEGAGGKGRRAARAARHRDPAESVPAAHARGRGAAQGAGGDRSRRRGSCSRWWCGPRVPATS